MRRKWKIYMHFYKMSFIINSYVENSWKIGKIKLNQNNET